MGLSDGIDVIVGENETYLSPFPGLNASLCGVIPPRFGEGRGAFALLRFYQSSLRTSGLQLFFWE